MQAPPQRKAKSATRARDRDHRRSDNANHRDYHNRDRDIVMEDDELGQHDSNNNFSSFSSPRWVLLVVITHPSSSHPVLSLYINSNLYPNYCYIICIARMRSSSPPINPPTRRKTKSASRARDVVVSVTLPNPTFL